VAKRFTDTELYDKPWFMALSCRLKCAVEYLFKKCDNTGVWEPNYIIASAYIGEGGFTEQELLAIDGGEQFEKLPSGKIFVVGFCDFQYGELTENCKPHRSIIQKLKKTGLFERVSKGYTKGTSTLQEKDKEKEKEKEEEKEQDFGKSENLLPDDLPEPAKPKREPNIKPEKDDQKALKAQYAETVAQVKAMADPKDQKVALAKFITDHKPKFIEPYGDLWNVSVKPYGLSQVELFPDSRLKKFKTRVREPGFDFVKILSEIKISDYLQGKVNGWRVDWEWIFENDNNYLRIIEGKYRNSTN
jgi:hypothetical protein